MHTITTTARIKCTAASLGKITHFLNPNIKSIGSRSLWCPACLHPFSYPNYHLLTPMHHLSMGKFTCVHWGARPRQLADPLSKQVGKTDTQRERPRRAVHWQTEMTFRFSSSRERWFYLGWSPREIIAELSLRSSHWKHSISSIRCDGFVFRSKLLRNYFVHRQRCTLQRHNFTAPLGQRVAIKLPRLCYTLAPATCYYLAGDLADIWLSVKWVYKK